MRDFNMTPSQKAEVRRHFTFKLDFNSVRITTNSAYVYCRLGTPKNDDADGM